MEDIIRRRQLLKEKLEGKSTENLSSPSSKQTKVKTNPTRLNIPTIFQLNKSSENLSAAPKLFSQNISTSKSTGNIYQDSSLKLANFEESTAKVPTKPARKLSTSFCLKVDDTKSNEDLVKSSQNEGKLRFSQSFSIAKTSSNIPGLNYEGDYNESEKKEGNIFRTNAERKFTVSSGDLRDELQGKITTSPVIVSSIRKQNHEETNKTGTNKENEAAAEGGLVLLRKKLSDLRASKNKRASVDSLPTMSFNFTDQNKSPTALISPESPILKNLEKHPNLKRSGSRVGFLVREEMMKQNEENNNDDAESLYDNFQLKHTPVENEKQNNVVDNKENINNNSDIVDSLYDNIKLKNKPLDHYEDKSNQNFPTTKTFVETNNKKTDEVLLQNEASEEIEKDNSLYGKFDAMDQCDKEEMTKSLQKKYSNIINEALYENMDVIRANNYYSRKFLSGPVNKKPLPTVRSAFFN